MRGGGGRGRRRKLSGDARYTSNGDKFPRKIFTDAKLYRFLGPRRGRGSERREVDGELEGRDAQRVRLRYTGSRYRGRFISGPETGRLIGKDNRD